MTKFQIGIKALIFKGDKILILQRTATAPSFPLTWDLPGGLLEENELPIKAIIREINEETSLDVQNPMLISNTIFLRKGVPTLVLFYKFTYIDGRITLSSEHQEYKWIWIESIMNENLQPWIKDHLNEIL